MARALALRDVPDAADRWTVPLDSAGPIAVCLREQRPLWMEASGSWRASHPDTAAVMDSLNIPSAVALPLIVAGRPVGAIGIGFADARRLTPAERTTLLALTEPAAQALDRARLYRTEHRIAQTLQRRLLPERLPALDRLTHATRYRAAAAGMQAGGDWYDVIALGDARAAIVVGDVVGHGPEAAAVMGQLRTVLSGALRQGHGPGAALDQLSGFASWIPGARASTAACLLLDWERGELRWSRAGHLPPLVTSGGRARYLEGVGHGPVLGLADVPGYTEGVTSLSAGDTLLLYTDGLVERRGEDLDDGLGRLVQTVTKLSTESPDTIVDQLLEILLEADEQRDDVALVCARLLPPPLRLTIPAEPGLLPAIRRRVDEWARQVGLTEELTDDLQLALGEAAANSAEHAYPERDGEMHIQLTRTSDGRVHAEVRDAGRWRPPPSDPGHRGRGLALIRALTTTTDIHGDERGTQVRFELAASAAPQAAERRRPRPDMRSDHPAARLRAVGGEPDGRRLVVEGDLDVNGSAAIRAVLLESVRRDHVTLLIPAPCFLASNGTALLAEAAESAHDTGHRLRLVAPRHSAPRRTLELVGLAGLLAED
jgi:anti-sigma regulatory factor (Ser/Thr protein kinase)